MRVKFKKGELFRGDRVWRQKQGQAYAYFTSHKPVCADGAPDAYHPDDVGKDCYNDPHIGLDCPRHAGYPNTSWWNLVLVRDPNDPSKAFVKDSGPYEGYFVCMTALRKHGGDKYDNATYVDASSVPYVVRPTGFENLPNVAKKGDVGIATHVPTGLQTAFIVGETGGGSKARLGESSIHLFELLGGQNVNARTGAGVPAGIIQYVVFNNSRPSNPADRWPRTNREIKEQAYALADSVDGIDMNLPPEVPPRSFLDKIRESISRWTS